MADVLAKTSEFSDLIGLVVGGFLGYVGGAVGAATGAVAGYLVAKEIVRKHSSTRAGGKAKYEKVP
jgi:uncharacterized membrane protein YdjX (TVP38/TMEM64 family)